ncbi:MAG: hypothetical protein ACJ8AT_06255 [Hyalangium sp.]|uniref:hypothetical protein n=1 Tax=Hyalangium sp. TaxID=2028555 RepID=UPI00389999F1
MKLTPVEQGTYRLVARLLREGRRKLEKQTKLGVAMDPRQLELLGQLANRAQAIALEEVQPDLFSG